ncbi:ribosome maturation factor RimM [Clostridium swellfunianum]|uniref:ribosome maturation factor RimM n=1 Tax=Clostridium swellfunianum TaxID=1367462 RepID=UPI00202F1A1F|nr:ribosome maturation factor RimM [Clostridium swellfunianum]MCM0648695.1 ribosome maturation factor RimM [Clostridium swellfunianum]
MKEFLAVGQIINTHGVKGEIKVYPLTDDIKRFRKLKEVYIDGNIIKILWCKLQVDKVILKLEGIESIEQAIKYKDKYIEVKREDAVKLDEGEYFIADLIGCKVFDEDNKELGDVFDVIQTPSNDVYWVKGNTEVLVPALKDIVTNIDVENRKIVIKALEVWQ